MKRPGKFLTVLALLASSTTRLISQEAVKNQDFTSNLDEDFSFSTVTLKELFLQQNDGGTNLKELINIAVGSLLIFLAIIGIVKLVGYILTRKKMKVIEEKFIEAKKSVLDTKMDTLSKDDFTKIIDSGIVLSKKVDKHTGRKNSPMLPLLAYEISLEMNVDKKTAARYFCASLFYDCGLLDIPSEYFFSEILYKKEKNQFKKHVICFDGKIDELPAELYMDCYDACYFHHENYNGSGYPEGLSKDEIPLIARILRVLESYMSLISKETYHKGLSKKKAFIEMRMKEGLYDMSIIDILETLV